MLEKEFLNRGMFEKKCLRPPDFNKSWDGIRFLMKCVT